MDTKKCSVRYHELVANIEAAQIYDGRNKGIDVYVCDKCGAKYHTRYKDKGVTPFTIPCRKCNKGTMVHKTTMPENIANFMGLSKEVHNWVRPSFEQFMKLDEGAREHVLQGGLMLEDELEKDKSIVKEKFNQVQELLDSLQGEDATCLFIGHEGNHFVISGNPTIITAQIVFAMCRYPVVRQIIQKCADNYEELNKKFGDKVRNITMDHLIEKKLW